jgi:hypothetical protein
MARKDSGLNFWRLVAVAVTAGVFLTVVQPVVSRIVDGLRQ